MDKVYSFDRITRILNHRLQPCEALNLVMHRVSAYPRVVQETVRVSYGLCLVLNQFFEINFFFELRSEASSEPVFAVSGRVTQCAYPDCHGCLWTLERNGVTAKYSKFSSLLYALGNGIKGRRTHSWPRTRRRTMITDRQAFSFLAEQVCSWKAVVPGSAKFKFVGGVHTETAWNIDFEYSAILVSGIETRYARFSSYEIYRGLSNANGQYFALSTWVNDEKTSRCRRAHCFDLETAVRWLKNGIPPSVDFGWYLNAFEYADIYKKDHLGDRQVPSLGFVSWLFH